MRMGLPATRPIPLLAGIAAILRRLLRATFLVALVGVAFASGAAVVPHFFGYGTLVVHGGSMGDSIPNGSLVVGRWMAAEDVRVGDVILITERSEEPGAAKIHRVVSLESDAGQVLVRTKGDANEAEDPELYVLPDRVLTPVHTLPYLGHVVGFAKTFVGWAILVALPGTVMCILTLRGIWADGDRPAAKPVRP